MGDRDLHPAGTDPDVRFGLARSRTPAALGDATSVILLWMASLVAEDGDLRVRLSRREKLGALHGDIRVPLDAVEDLHVSHRPFSELRGTRAPGTGIPRVIALGTWRYRGGKDCAALYRGKPAVIVRLRDAPFQRLLIAADDADAVAAAL